jgi:hypothetical protein
LKSLPLKSRLLQRRLFAVWLCQRNYQKGCRGAANGSVVAESGGINKSKSTISGGKGSFLLELTHKA